MVEQRRLGKPSAFEDTILKTPTGPKQDRRMLSYPQPITLTPESGFAARSATPDQPLTTNDERGRGVA
jgi:hypothetical protein